MELKETLKRLEKRLDIKIEGVIDCENTKKIIFSLQKGNYASYKGEIPLDTLLRRVSISYRDLSDQEKKRAITDMAEARGYTVIEYPEGLKAHKKVILKSPLNNIWHVQWNAFVWDKKLNCPADRCKSYGESCVSTILRENSIPFISEKSIVNNKGDHQRLDFYWEHEGKKYAIEYHGIQHTKETSGSWSGSLADRKKKDLLKEQYCIDNNIQLVIVPHTQGTKKEIYTFLSNKLDSMITKYEGDNVNLIRLGIPDSEYFTKVYYKYSNEEASNILGISVAQVRNWAKKIGVSKGRRPVTMLNIETLEEREFSQVSEAKDFIGTSSVRGCVTGAKKQVRGWLARYSDLPFSDVAKRITDDRIVFLRVQASTLSVVLPVYMIENYYSIPRKSIQRYVDTGITVQGVKLTSIGDEERQEAVSKVTYIDYIQSIKKKLY